MCKFRDSNGKMKRIVRISRSVLKRKEKEKTDNNNDRTD